MNNFRNNSRFQSKLRLVPQLLGCCDHTSAATLAAPGFLGSLLHVPRLTEVSRGAGDPDRVQTSDSSHFPGVASGMRIARFHVGLVTCTS
jgi:hypothetical protein